MPEQNINEMFRRQRLRPMRLMTLPEMEQPATFPVYSVQHLDLPITGHLIDLPAPSPRHHMHECKVTAQGVTIVWVEHKIEEDPSMARDLLAAVRGFVDSHEARGWTLRRIEYNMVMAMLESDGHTSTAMINLRTRKVRIVSAVKKSDAKLDHFDEMETFHMFIGAQVGDANVASY